VRAEPGDAWEWTQSFDGMSIKDNDIVNSDIVIHDHNVIIILLSFQQAQLARTGRGR
jgi:hypothetical protein